MNLFFYSTINNKIVEKLTRLIENFFPKEKIDVSREIMSLSRKIRKARDVESITILSAANKEDLLDILSIRNLIRDIRIILILPDREEDTIALGQSLSPSLLCFIDSDLTEICSILGKMLVESRTRERKIKWRRKRGYLLTWI